MKATTKKTMKEKLPAFLIGLVVGTAGALMVPELLTEDFAGTVTGKKRLRDRLMVMINMPQGEVIATFTDKIGQIDFLIRPGDEVALGLAKYEVLVDNPPLVGVKRVDGSEIVGDETAEDLIEMPSAATALMEALGGDPVSEPAVVDPAVVDPAVVDPAATEPAAEPAAGAAEPAPPDGGAAANE